MENCGVEVDLGPKAIQVAGHVTRYIDELHKQSLNSLALAPSPIELLHHYACDHNVLRQSSMVYKSV